MPAPAHSATPVDRYLELGLRMGKHLEGMVDAYYGPAELAARVDDEPTRSLPALVVDGRTLLADLDTGDGDLDATRRRWLRAQVVGLHTSARQLAGEAVTFVDEVESCYGVRPSPVPHDELADAHRQLDAVLPGSGPLAERLDAWRTTHLLTRDQLTAAVHTLAEAFREQADAAFGLPDGEHVDFELVTDQPWSGFNYYDGDLQSRVAINTDLPVSSTAIGHLIAHEAYPGHHTEHCLKEVGIVRERGHLEESIFLVGTPQCLLAEGLADTALEALLGTVPQPALAELLHPLGIHYDTEVVAAVARASEALGSVRGNVALMLHDQGRPEDEVVAELEQWALLSHERAVKSISFLTHPTWRAYVFCYVAGYPLCRDFVAGDPARFERLLTEQFVPADLLPV